MTDAQKNAHIQISDDSHELCCTGNWRLQYLTPLQAQLQAFKPPTAKRITINAFAIDTLDSAGAWLLFRLSCLCATEAEPVKVDGLKPKQQALFDSITKEAELATIEPTGTPHYSLLYHIGKNTLDKLQHGIAFLTFVGEVTVELMKAMVNPRLIQWKSFFNAIDLTGFRALPIVALLTFLIGVVMAYQMGLMLKNYGANIYIVDFSGMAILREFAPLITAIIVAGRTSSAFAAEIGMMKVNEELDAIQTMGLSPINRIVLPKILGLFVALPLLTVWASIFGLLGSMVMANNILHINFSDFFSRLPRVIELRTYLIGLGKAPVFALIISAVGCFQGFQVSYTASSVGKRTTISVVQAIFLIIIADAISSIIFSWQGI